MIDTFLRNTHYTYINKYIRSRKLGQYKLRHRSTQIVCVKDFCDIYEVQMNIVYTPVVYKQVGSG